MMNARRDDNLRVMLMNGEGSAFLCVAICGTTSSTTYITEADMRDDQQYMDMMGAAISEGNTNELKKIARDFLSNNQRNAKIAKHEEAIASIMDIIMKNIKVGQGTTLHWCADTIVRACPWVSEGHTRYSTNIPKSPIGATTTALLRLVEQGYFRTEYGLNPSGNPARIYIRIK